MHRRIEVFSNCIDSLHSNGVFIQLSNGDPQSPVAVDASAAIINGADKPNKIYTVFVNEVGKGT